MSLLNFTLVGKRNVGLKSSRLYVIKHTTIMLYTQKAPNDLAHDGLCMAWMRQLIVWGMGPYAFSQALMPKIGGKISHQFLKRLYTIFM